MTEKTIKAQRAQIQLGELTLDVFQLPDGSYRLSARQITEAIEIRHSRVAEICATKCAQELIGKGIQVAEKSGISSDIGNISGYSLETALFVWQYESFKGNKLAQALVIACGVETLERRADAAFEVVRTEEQRNIRFQTRLEGILSRTFWTDTVDAYLNTVNYPRDERWYVYSTISDMVNRKIFGMTAKEIKEFMGLKDTAKTRDFLPTDTLKLIDTIERAAGVRLDNNDTVPTQALKDVIALLGLEPDSSKLLPGKSE